MFNVSSNFLNATLRRAFTRPHKPQFWTANALQFKSPDPSLDVATCVVYLTVIYLQICVLGTSGDHPTRRFALWQLSSAFCHVNTCHHRENYFMWRVSDTFLTCSSCYPCPIPAGFHHGAYFLLFLGDSDLWKVELFASGFHKYVMYVRRNLWVR